jgi:hypothetical protein
VCKIKELCTKLVIDCYYIRMHGQPNMKTGLYRFSKNVCLVSHTSFHNFAFLDFLHLDMSCLPEAKMDQCGHGASVDTWQVWTRGKSGHVASDSKFDAFGVLTHVLFDSLVQKD